MNDIACEEMSYVDHPRRVTLFEVVQHRSFIEVGHHGHILNFIELWRIHREHLVILHSEGLKNTTRTGIKMSTNLYNFFY